MAGPVMQNVWHLRRVAEASAKSCDICYKPTTSVLITPDNKDFFYLCPGHLKDRSFCSPIADEAEIAAKKRKEHMEREIEIVVKEYEDKVKRKKESKEDEKKEQEKDDKKAKVRDGVETAEKEKNDKVRFTLDMLVGGKLMLDDSYQILAIMGNNAVAASDEMPRIYALQKQALSQAPSVRCN
ncbi:MAG: hypothetical protein Q9163_005060 [Psora crenata]